MSLFGGMNIYAYHTSGYLGEKVRIQLTPTPRNLSVLGISPAQQKSFKLKAHALFALLGRGQPDALIQVPPTKECASLELAMLLALLLSGDQLLQTLCPDILVMGKVNLDGSITPMPTLLDAPEVALRNGCKLLIAPPTPNPYNCEGLEIVQCVDLSTMVHQCRRFILYHEGERALPFTEPPPLAEAHPFSAIIGLERQRRL